MELAALIWTAIVRTDARRPDEAAAMLDSLLPEIAAYDLETGHDAGAAAEYRRAVRLVRQGVESTPGAGGPCAAGRK